MNVDLKEWARSICKLVAKGEPVSEQTLKSVEFELKTIAMKYSRKGYWNYEKR